MDAWGDASGSNKFSGRQFRSNLCNRCVPFLFLYGLYFRPMQPRARQFDF